MRNWLVGAAAEEIDLLQRICGLAGERHLIEWTSDSLPGFAASAPVPSQCRARLLQLDVYGEMLDALHQAREHGIGPVSTSWRLKEEFADHIRSLDAVRRRHLRGAVGACHFAHPRVMAWVGLKRCIRGIEALGLNGAVEK